MYQFGTYRLYVHVVVFCEKKMNLRALRLMGRYLPFIGTANFNQGFGSVFVFYGSGSSIWNECGSGSSILEWRRVQIQGYIFDQNINNNPYLCPSTKLNCCAKFLFVFISWKIDKMDLFKGFLMNFFKIKVFSSHGSESVVKIRIRIQQLCKNGSETLILTRLAVFRIRN